MAFGIKDYEIQRVSSVLKLLGWEVVGKSLMEKEIILTIHRTFSEELLRAAGELKPKPSP